MKATILTFGIVALVILTSLAYDHLILHPVGRYLPCGSTMRRMDTVTGKVEVWCPETEGTKGSVNFVGEWMVPPSPPHKAGWVELGK